MKQFIIAMVIFFASAGILADEINFQYQAPKTNSVENFKNNFKYDVDLNVKQGRQQQKVKTSTHLTEERETKLLELVKNQVKKIQVQYKTMKMLMQQTPGGKQENSMPVEGKTYIIKKDGNKVVVTDEKNKPVSPEEVQMVEKLMDHMGENDPMTKFLNKKTAKKGETLTMPPEMARDVFKHQMEVKEFSLTLSEVKKVNEKKCGVFATVVKMAGADVSGASMSADMTGTTIIGENCQMISMTLTGDVTMSAKMGPVEIAGKGTMSIALEAGHQ